MASRPQNEERFVTTIHGNCVFSGAVHPVRIDHFANGAVISPIDGSDTGVIHFALPLVLDSWQGPGQSIPTRIASLEALDVDFVQVQGDPQHFNRRPSDVVKAEIFVGCEEYWCSDMNRDRSFTVQVKDPVGVLSLERPKGIGVTLTIRFRGDSLRFCSVGVFGKVVERSSRGIRADEE